MCVYSLCHKHRIKVLYLKTLLSVAGVVSLFALLVPVHVHVVVFEHLSAGVESWSVVAQWSHAEVGP